MLGGALLGLGGALANIISAILAVGLIVLAVTQLVRLFRGKHTSSQARGQPAHVASYDDQGSQLTQRTAELGYRLEPQARSAAPLAQFQAESTLATQPLCDEWCGVPPDFVSTQFCVPPRPISYGCSMPGIGAMSATFASSPVPRSFASCVCNGRRAVRRRMSPMWSRCTLDCLVSKPSTKTISPACASSA